MKCGLLGSKSSKGQMLDLGRMFANDAKTVYFLFVLTLLGPGKYLHVVARMLQAS